VDASAAKEVVSPSVVDKNVAKDIIVLGSFPPLPTHVTTSAGNAPGMSLYANITGKPSGKKVKVRTLFTPRDNGIDVVVPVDSIRAISERFAYTTYSFFVGKKVAYPVIANYVRNTSGKYGLIRSTFSSSTRLFSFQFSFMNGLDAMFENGPWFIHDNSLIRKKWHPNENLLKEDVSTVPVRVKLYGVHVMAFSEDGLSAIANKLERQNCDGKHRLLDNDENPLVPMSIVESDSEVEVVFDETANLRISKSGKDGSNKGYGTNSLLKQ
nr:hypothetical protein [Tanacetum cinerariifolium]